ncbi:MAG: bile acid:sodium symporter family protein, partial [Bacteroidota bacterium]
MSKHTIARIFLAAGAIGVLTGAALLLTGNAGIAGYFLIPGLIITALSFQGFSGLSGFTYTTFIFAAVALAMYFPSTFISAGNFQFKTLIIPLLQLIMFGVGCTMGLKDFEGVV